MKKLLIFLSVSLLLVACEPQKEEDIKEPLVVDEHSLSTATKNMEDLESYTIKGLYTTPDGEFKTDIYHQDNLELIETVDGSYFTINLDDTLYMVEPNSSFQYVITNYNHSILGNYDTSAKYDYDAENFTYEDGVFKANDIDNNDQITIKVEVIDEQFYITNITINNEYDNGVKTTYTINYENINSTTLDFPEYEEPTKLDMLILKWTGEGALKTVTKRNTELIFTGIESFTIKKGESLIKITRNEILTSGGTYIFNAETMEVQSNEFSEGYSVTDKCTSNYYLSCEEFELLKEIYNEFQK